MRWLKRLFEAKKLEIPKSKNYEMGQSFNPDPQRANELAREVRRLASEQSWYIRNYPDDDDTIDFFHNTIMERNDDLIYALGSKPYTGDGLDL